MSFPVKILEKIFPCEYRERCLAKPNITKYHREYYKSCRMSCEDSCVSARIYRNETGLIEDMGLASRINEGMNWKAKLRILL